MADDLQERTEQATPRRRQEARERGQVARSREIPSVVVLAAGVGALVWLLPWMGESLLALTREVFQSLDTLRLDGDQFLLFFQALLRWLAATLFPLLAVVTVAAGASNVFQFGLLWSPQVLEPQWSRMDPLQGAKRLFSLQSLMELAKSLLKVAIVGAVIYLLIRRELPYIPHLAQMSVGQILVNLEQMGIHLVGWVVGLLFVLALLDYAFQRWEYERGLRMTREELREELRRTEGDPLVRARIRSMQRELARRRMMAEVPKADVVITNPAHLAVALAYQYGKMRAPKVVAKGAGHLAERIKAVARAHGVVIVEDRPLAQILYRTVEIGQEIPEHLYRAVAEILAFVYRLRRGEA